MKTWSATALLTELATVEGRVPGSVAKWCVPVGQVPSHAETVVVAQDQLRTLHLQRHLVARAAYPCVSIHPKNPWFIQTKKKLISVALAHLSSCFRTNTMDRKTFLKGLAREVFQNARKAGHARLGVISWEKIPLNGVALEDVQALLTRLEDALAGIAARGKRNNKLSRLAGIGNDCMTYADSRNLATGGVEREYGEMLAGLFSESEHFQHTPLVDYKANVVVAYLLERHLLKGGGEGKEDAS